LPYPHDYEGEIEDLDEGDEGDDQEFYRHHYSRWWGADYVVGASKDLNDSERESESK
jgi:hypothetical protein